MGDREACEEETKHEHLGFALPPANLPRFGRAARVLARSARLGAQRANPRTLALLALPIS